MAAPANDALNRPPRRFYAEVGIAPVEGGHGLLLDGRLARTPGARALALPTPALAELIAEEWRAQGEQILYADMPATRLAHTALDIVSGARSLSVEGVTRFAGADLVCYFAEGPGSLVRRQEETWGPLLEWARDELGLTLNRARGIVHTPQPPEALARLEALATPLDDFDLAGLAFAAPLFGSAVIALALRAGRIDAAEAMAASRLDEIFQEERWGVDAEAAAQVDVLAAEAAMVERWFRALAPLPAR
jgi:chaperone required for assembly of F1-ATPase